ncbi:MAG: PorV/PorQ family protein [Elusimicrobia bacterium]|nr:PorV/PorQ family protein [Candidatus Obscuribacterium magneticum]
MKNHTSKIFTLITGLIFSVSPLFAAGQSGGLTFLALEGGARSAGLANSFTSMFNDIGAMTYNPASLGTLETGQASFLYQKGLMDDAYGHLLLGSPTKRGGLGFSFGYYNAGDMELYDGVSPEVRSVNAQTDFTMGVGVARNIGKVSTGMNLKYLQSTLIEQNTARAYAADVGMSVPFASRLRFGLALRNFGTEVKYVAEGDKLPQTISGGLAISLFPSKAPTTLLLEAPYYINEQETNPSVGVEVALGPLAVRAGYKKNTDASEITMGTGFLIGPTSIDYAFGMVENFDTQHKVGMSLRFGGPASQKLDFAKKAQPKREVVARKETPAPRPRLMDIGSQPTLRAPAYTEPPKARKEYRIYMVKKGDTLQKIAQKMYGSGSQWKSIYTANKHLLDDPTKIEIGQKIIIP